MSLLLEPPMLHLLFVDDCLLLKQATVVCAQEFRRILQDYCLPLGQRVKFLKSEIHFSPKTPTRLQHLIQDILGIAKYGGASVSGGTNYRGQIIEG